MKKECAATSSELDFAFVLWLWAADTLTPSDHIVYSGLKELQFVHLMKWGGKSGRTISTHSCSFERCRGTTKRRLMDTWTSWRRPQGKIWTLQMRMAWPPLYWPLSTDILMPFSSYAAESKHDSLLYTTTVKVYQKTLFVYVYLYVFYCWAKLFYTYSIIYCYIFCH